MSGRIIGKQNDPTSSVASGIWSLQEQYFAEKAGNWPSAPSPATEISLVGSATAGSTANWTLSSNAITGVQNGDLLILATSDDLSTDPSPTAGWTTIYNNTAFDGTSQAGLFYKYAMDSDVSVNSGGSPSSAAVLFALRNAIIDTTVVQTGTDTNDPGSISASERDWVLAIAHAQDHNNTTTLTAPSGYTDIDDFASDGDGAGTTFAWTYVAYKRSTTTGTEDPGAFGGTLASTNFMRCTTVRTEPVETLFWNDGTTLSGWTNGSGSAAASVQVAAGNPANSLQATGGEYAYYDLGESLLGKKITFDIYLINGTNELANFFFGCDSSGQGNFLRVEGRTSQISGLSTSTSWTLWNAPTAGRTTPYSVQVWHSVEISINSNSEVTWAINGTTQQTNVAVTLQGNIFAIHGDAGVVAGAVYDNIRIQSL